MADTLLPGTFEGMGLDPFDMNHARRANATRGGTQALDPANIANLQPWQDAAYQQATRALDPQFQQQEARFRQQMVNQGFAEGSEGWNNAYANFDRSRNDAYGSARNQALAQALAAQNQGFSQSLGLDQLASQNAATNASRAGQALDRQMEREWRDRQFGEDTRRWDLSRGDSLDQQDFNNLMGLNAFDFGAQQFDAGQQQQDFNNQLPFFGLIPNQGPTQIDTYAPYGMQQQAEQANANRAGAQQNGTMGAIGGIASAALMVF